MAIHIGHRRAGWPGLVVAGLSFLLPAVAIVWALAWAYVRFGRLPQVAGLLYGVNVASLALMATVTWQLGWGAVRDWPTALLAVASGVLLLRYRVNSTWLVAAGALSGILLTRFA